MAKVPVTATSLHFSITILLQLRAKYIPSCQSMEHRWLSFVRVKYVNVHLTSDRGWERNVNCGASPEDIFSSWCLVGTKFFGHSIWCSPVEIFSSMEEVWCFSTINWYIILFCLAASKTIQKGKRSDNSLCRHVGTQYVGEILYSCVIGRNQFKQDRNHGLMTHMQPMRLQRWHHILQYKSK